MSGNLSGRFLGLVLVWSAIGGALLPGTGWAQWVKLSDGMPFSDVTEFVISPSGDRVVYCDDAVTDGASDIWSVPVAGGTPVRLNDPLPAGASGCRVGAGARGDLTITLDGARVIYLADQRAVGVQELYSAPITGGSPAVRLSGSPVLFGQVQQFLVSPDGSRVVYVADQQVDERFEIYSVSITGGAAIKLNGALVSGGDVLFNKWEISPDASRVVYHADQQTDDVFELYSVPIAGGTSIKLNGALASGGDLFSSAIGPGSNRVVYIADQETDQVLELYSVPILGGLTVKLNSTLAPGVRVIDARVSPDGSRVVYRAGGNPVFDLYSVPIGGGMPVNLNAPIVGLGLGVRNDVTITPNGNRVVYRAQTGLVDPCPFPCELHDNLYSAPIAGGTALKLSNTLVPAGDVFGFKISPDGSRVVYDQDSDIVRRRGWMASPSGPAESGVFAWGANFLTLGPIARYRIEPGSGNVVVLAEKLGEVAPIRRLWRAPLGPVGNFFGARELIPKADFAAGGEVREFAIGPKGSVVYVADQDTDEVFELYAIAGVIFSNGFE